MTRLFLFLALLLGALVLTSLARASEEAFPTQREAAAAAFVAMLPDWNVRGACGSLSDETPAPNDVCYRRAQRFGDETYGIYTAHALAAVDGDWWAGLLAVEGGWKSYGGGRCDFFYCRIAAPDDEVLLGYPDGDVNCDGAATSVDAALVLQVVAALIDRAALPCDDSIDADPRDGGVTSIDALAILQSSAGLIGGLPVVLEE